MSGVRVVVADDHPVYRDGLVRAWEDHPGIEVVAAVGDGRAALAAIHREAPDVAVIDLRLPEIDGLQVLETLQQEDLPTRAVVLTAYVDSASVYRAIAGGARAYLEKAASSETISEAVLLVAGGGTLISPLVQDGLANEIRNRRLAVPRPTLTLRETDILKLAADGCPAQEIADRLHISIATVKTHLQHVYEKLEVSDRAAAVAQAIRRGLLQ
ncbi:response regulator [Streptomyces sp. NPDC058001]|uniref:response regulator transcription factor n=1 Tax=Streptomyces sp. NPDC058001 TaxID=3346300 RepID=UPI0036EF4649